MISGVFVRTGSYTCNCFLCLATIFPRFASCAKWMSRCCGCLCCGQIDAFREDCVKCSQLAANIYQAMGLMDPLINPSSVLPVDFLPGELLQSPEEGDDGHALHDSMQFHLHEVSSLAEHRSTEAIFDTDHPKHARHRQLSMDGMIDADDSTPDARAASVQAFFKGFPSFDPEVVPLKVRKDSRKFANENAADAKARWTRSMSGVNGATVDGAEASSNGAGSVEGEAEPTAAVVPETERFASPNRPFSLCDNFCIHESCGADVWLSCHVVRRRSTRC